MFLQLSLTAYENLGFLIGCVGRLLQCKSLRRLKGLSFETLIGFSSKDPEGPMDN